MAHPVLGRGAFSIRRRHTRSHRSPTLPMRPRLILASTPRPRAVPHSPHRVLLHSLPEQAAPAPHSVSGWPPGSEARERTGHDAHTRSPDSHGPSSFVPWVCPIRARDRPSQPHAALEAPCCLIGPHTHTTSHRVHRPVTVQLVPVLAVAHGPV